MGPRERSVLIVSQVAIALTIILIGAELPAAAAVVALVALAGVLGLYWWDGALRTIYVVGLIAASIVAAIVGWR
jgi:hypothetical protein